MSTRPSFAAALEQRFSARPHVGVVTHFEGLDVPQVVRRVRRVLERLDLRPAGAIEQMDGGAVFNAVASLPVGTAMELWIIATERTDVGTKLETRVFHRLEESALADEYLAMFAGHLTPTA